jgi:hypothetical protein
MTAQSVQDQPNLLQQEIAVFDNLNAAQKAEALLRNSDFDLGDITIKGDINAYEEVAAMGTTVGAEAGLLLGAFLGGSLGILVVSILSTVIYGNLATTSLTQLSTLGFIAAGALVGAIAGQRIRQNHLPAQKQKGNPDVPRRFQLQVEGSKESLAQAKEALGYPVS